MKRPRLRTLVQARSLQSDRAAQAHASGGGPDRHAGREARAAQRCCSLDGRVRVIISTWLFLDVYGVCCEQRRVCWWQDDPVGAAMLWGAMAPTEAVPDERLACASNRIVAVNERAQRSGCGSAGFRRCTYQRLRRGHIRRRRRRRRPVGRVPQECDRRLRTAGTRGRRRLIAPSDRHPQQPHGPGRTRGRGRLLHGLLLIGPKDSTLSRRAYPEAPPIELGSTVGAPGPAASRWSQRRYQPYAVSTLSWWRSRTLSAS